MLKRIWLSLCIVPMLLLCSSCGAELGDQPIREEDGTLVWKGFTVEHSYYGGSATNVFVPENVLTTQDQVLSVLFGASSGSPVQFGMKEIIQVNLDGEWYSLPDLLMHREQPLIMAPLSDGVEYRSEESKTAHSVDLSPFGALPPGKYRLVEEFFWGNVNKEYQFAYFWVIAPGGKRPIESETTGTARLEDIAFSVDSPYAAQRTITDQNYLLRLNITNLSGKWYNAKEAILEIWKAGQWENVAFQHANLGLIFNWGSSSELLFLDEPLEVGDYRIRLIMSVFNLTGTVEPQSFFSVLSGEEAPIPQWKVSQLHPSPIDVAEVSSGVTMTLKSPVLTMDNLEFEFVLTAIDDYSYFYGEPFTIEVLLDGSWYSVPFASDGFDSIGYGIDSSTSLQDRTHTCHPLWAAGILPAGQYRLLKEFMVNNPSIDEDNPIYLGKEFAIAEFTVETTLELRKYS